MVLRVTKQASEVLAAGNGNVRVTKQASEVLAAGNGTVRVTKQNTEVLAKVLSVFDLTGSNTLSFTQTATLPTIGRTAGNTLTFTQSASVENVIPLTSSNTLSFTQSGSNGQIDRTANNTLTFTQSGVYPEVKDLTASNTLLFTQSARTPSVARTASHNLSLVQTNNRVREIVGAIELTASNTLSFTQTNNRVHVKATAVDLTASNTLTFVQNALFPLELSASDILSFTQSADGFPGKTATQSLDLVQSVVLNKVTSLTASNTINFSQAFTWAQFRNGIPFLGTKPCGVIRQYAPFSGSGSLVRPIPPALNRQTDVLFFFPKGPICEATDSITLRTPNFGDRDRNQYNRINRESRGGSLRIFRDSKWPKQRTLVMDFSGLKDSEVDSILAFLEDTLGQKVGFRDWNSRLWFGIIVTPDASIVRQGTNRNDLSVEMEVDDVTLELQACNSMVFTQSNSVQKVTP